MFPIKLSESVQARKRTYIYLVDATDGKTPETGVTGPTIYITKGAGTPGTHSGTFGEISAANMPGWYYYEWHSTEIDTLGINGLRVVKSGTSAEFAAEIPIVAYDPYSATNLGLTGIPTGSPGTLTGMMLKSDMFQSVTAYGTWTSTTANLTENPYGCGMIVVTTSSGTQMRWITSIATGGGGYDCTIYPEWDTGVLPTVDAAILSAYVITGPMAQAIWATAIRSLTDKTGFSLTPTTGLGNQSGSVGSVSDASNIATAVWASGTRTLTSFGTLIADIWSYATRTLTAISDSSGVTTLLGRILGTIDTGTHKPQSGDAYTAVTGLTIPSESSIADAVWDEATSGHGTNATYGCLLGRIATIDGSDFLSVSADYFATNQMSTNGGDNLIRFFDNGGIPITTQVVSFIDVASSTISGGSGGGLTVLPVQATFSQPTFTSNGVQHIPLEVAQNSASNITFAIIDNTGTAVSLEGKQIRFVVHRGETALWSLNSTAGEIVISGNTAVVTIPAARTASTGSWEFKLWNLTDGPSVISTGHLKVRTAPIGS